MLLVGFDDALNKGVANHVAAGQVTDAKIGDILKNVLGFGESGFGGIGQVNLGGVAGDNAFGFVAEAGEEHEHLLAGGVLSFVEDDEGVVEGAATHVSQGRNFDDTAFNIFFDEFGGEHVVEGIV